jgi:hypothetical protein
MISVSNNLKRYLFNACRISKNKKSSFPTNDHKIMVGVSDVVWEKMDEVNVELQFRIKFSAGLQPEGKIK